MPDARRDDGIDPTEAVAEIRREFCDGLPQRLATIRAALNELAAGFERSHAETFFLQAHSLRGTAGAFGADDLADCAAVLSKIGRAWRQTEVVSEEELARALGELKRLDREVERYLRSVEEG